MASTFPIKLRTALATVFAGLVTIMACAQVDTDSVEWEPRTLARHPHDPGAFTQGLAFHNGRLFEGTGQHGRSSIREVEIATGRVERIQPLDALYFGEGITILDDRLYQLTWQSGIGFVYDVDSFARTGTFRYEGEGWGLTHDGRHLIMSDGTATLRFVEPNTFAVVLRLAVTDAGRPVERLNELEYVNGEIWSNVWYDDRIARISPKSGEVLGWIDLSELYPQSVRFGDDVLNGIAYDAEANRLLVTGKNWPQIFELEPPPRPGRD